jgi:hypothetical protein
MRVPRLQSDDLRLTESSARATDAAIDTLLKEMQMTVIKAFQAADLVD